MNIEDDLSISDLFQTNLCSMVQDISVINEVKEATETQVICHPSLMDQKYIKNNPASDVSPRKTEESNIIVNSSYFPLTMELRVNSIDDFLLTAEHQSGGKFLSKEPFCLIGLHTCGDLGSTALRLFTDISNANALCMVGCCYHHITEQEHKSGMFMYYYNIIAKCCAELN